LEPRDGGQESLSFDWRTSRAKGTVCFLQCVRVCFFVITPNQQVQDEAERLEGNGKDYKKLSILLQLKAKKLSL